MKNQDLKKASFFSYIWIFLYFLSCSNKEVVPKIEDIVGLYECKFEWSGAGNYSSKALIFKISKSLKDANSIEIQFLPYSDGLEIWEVKWDNNNISMDKQKVIEQKDSFNRIFSLNQQGTGKIFNDSLYFEGERGIEPNIYAGKVFCKYWAKKVK